MLNCVYGQHVFPGFAGHTWINASATASAAVVLFGHNYLPPDRETKYVSNVCSTKSADSLLTFIKGNMYHTTLDMALWINTMSSIFRYINSFMPKY